MILKTILNKLWLLIHKGVKSANNSLATRMLGGGRRSIAYPFIIEGFSNIHVEEPCYIGPGATLYSTDASIIIKQHFVAGPNLTIITGDHKFIPGRWLDSISTEEKDPWNDQDVIIKEDVWCGANVTILKGVTIGRSSIVAAGSVVTKSVPDFSIVAGVPAKVIKEKWNADEIAIHDEFIRNESLKK